MVLIALMLSGCQQSSVPKEPQKLKVAVFHADLFTRVYVPLLEKQFPDWEITVVPLNDDNFYVLREPEASNSIFNVINKEHPDLVMVQGYMYDVLANKDVFVDLQEQMSQSKHKLNLDTFAPSVISFLNNNEHGKLYGLSPIFRTSALYYNKSMFKSFGIEEPPERITWTEVLQLANRFMKDQRMPNGSYGFHLGMLSSPYNMIETIAHTEGIVDIDNRRGKVMMQSDAWTNIWRLVADSYSQGALSKLKRTPRIIDGVQYFDKEDLETADLFYKGLSAMTLAEDDLLRKLNSGTPKFQWGVVSGPVSSRDANKVAAITLDYVFTIPTVSTHPDAAWEVIHHLHSDTVGHILKATDQGLSTLKEYPSWTDDPRYEAFYNLIGWDNDNSYVNSIVSNETYRLFSTLVNEQMEATIAGNITTEQALAIVQSEGQLLLDKGLTTQ